MTIVKETSSKSPIVAKGKLHEFTTLTYSHCYRIVGLHPNQANGSFNWGHGNGSRGGSSDSDENRSGHYVLSSDSD